MNFPVSPETLAATATETELPDGSQATRPRRGRHVAIAAIALIAVAGIGWKTFSHTQADAAPMRLPSFRPQPR